MKKLIHLLQLKFVPANSFAGLLALRLWLGLSMLGLHGWSKLSGFSTLKDKFPDPLHLGSPLSLTFAVLAEVGGSLLLISGLFTRLAALGGVSTMAIAFFVVHGGKLQGEGNGELAFIYLAGYVTLLLAGGGKYALDQKL